MNLSYIVVDDFYRLPSRVRSVALEHSQWLPRAKGAYCEETENSFYTDALVARFEALVGRSITVNPKAMGFGVFSYYPADARVEETTHYDDTDWSAIAYLTPPQLCQGGIGFYKHKVTGLTGPPTEAVARDLGFDSVKDFLSRCYYPDKLNIDAWEQTDYVEMAWNRMVLLRGGDGSSTGRPRPLGETQVKRA